MRMIFVAGCARSGSSWLSEALTASTRGTLIREPFNGKVHPEAVEYEFKYMPAGSHDPKFLQIVRDATARARGRRWLLKALTGHGHFILKDVHALCSLEYMWESYHPPTAIVLRHPCAVAASWAKLKYDVDRPIEIIMGQGPLIKDHLQSCADHIRRHNDYFWKMGCIWGTVYRVMTQVAARFPQWQVVRHEDLCLDPVARIGEMVQAMGYRMSAQGRQFLLAHNQAPKPNENAYSVSRNAAAEVDKWKKKLTPENIDRVLNAAAPFGVMEKYYPQVNSAAAETKAPSKTSDDVAA